MKNKSRDRHYHYLKEFEYAGDKYPGAEIESRVRFRHHIQDPHQIGYSVSKAGIIQLTKWFASYLAPKVRVNCISPGGIIRKQSKKFVKAYNRTTLLKRMATEEDVISGILFLASDGSRYITGQNLIIDGGWSI